MTTYNSNDILRTISNEIASEEKTHRFYALQWLWDYVAVEAKDGLVELTPERYAILTEKSAQNISNISPMDYETYINIEQYSTNGDVSYTLRVTDIMNMDYYYYGSATTLDAVMDCIKLHLQNH